MHGHDEVIARFIPDVRRLGCSDPAMPLATILVRAPDGSMSLQPVDPDATLGQEALSTGAFRKGSPIVDPVSRRILGYEMEPAHAMTLRVRVA
jgi:hypothetical protein